MTTSYPGIDVGDSSGLDCSSIVQVSGNCDVSQLLPVHTTVATGTIGKTGTLIGSAPGIVVDVSGKGVTELCDVNVLLTSSDLDM